MLITGREQEFNLRHHKDRIVNDNELMVMGGNGIPAHSYSKAKNANSPFHKDK